MERVRGSRSCIGHRYHSRIFWYEFWYERPGGSFFSAGLVPGMRTFLQGVFVLPVPTVERTGV
jgi:hypothetical protein